MVEPSVITTGCFFGTRVRRHVLSRGPKGVASAPTGRGAATWVRQGGQVTQRRRCCSTAGRTSGRSMRSCTLTTSAGRSAGSGSPQDEQVEGRCSTIRSGSRVSARLWRSCPGLEEVREVFSGRCSFSTSSISSSLLRRSRSLRLIPTRNQPNRQMARGATRHPRRY